MMLLQHTSLSQGVSLNMFLSRYFSDDLKSRRTDVRIPKDNSLMVKGRHFGAADEPKQKEKSTWEPQELSSPSTISLDSGHSSVTTKSKGSKFT